MLVIGRKIGQYVEVVHTASGDRMMIGVARAQRNDAGQVVINLAFDDAARNFAIDRPGRRPPVAPPAAQLPATSPALPLVLGGLDRLHALESAGRNDSPEADAIRDAMDGPWATLGPDEQQVASLHSAGLAGGNRAEVPPARLDASPMCG